MKEETFRQAKLDNGDIVKYDATSIIRNNYPDWIYLGEGVIYTINGIEQSGTTRGHFFLKPKLTSK